MMKLSGWVISLILISTVGCGSFRSDIDEVHPDEDLDALIIEAKEVSYKHWICCTDLCKRNKGLDSVLRELQSPYVICECKNGKQFRVAKIREAKFR